MTLWSHRAPLGATLALALVATSLAPSGAQAAATTYDVFRKDGGAWVQMCNNIAPAGLPDFRGAYAACQKVWYQSFLGITAQATSKPDACHPIRVQRQDSTAATRYVGPLKKVVGTLPNVRWVSNGCR